jgi:hypothetical protein
MLLLVQYSCNRYDSVTGFRKSIFPSNPFLWLPAIQSFGRAERDHKLSVPRRTGVLPGISAGNRANDHKWSLYSGISGVCSAPVLLL